MPFYQVTAFQGLTLPADTLLKLSEEQRDRREGRIAEVPGQPGTQRLLLPSTFKAGEVLETVAPLPRGLMPRFAVECDGPPKEAVEAQQEAQQAAAALEEAQQEAGDKNGRKPGKKTPAGEGLI